MNLKVWDVSAGILILTEAGGKISNISGEEYTLFEDKYLVASNGKIHNEFIKIWTYKIIKKLWKTYLVTIKYNIYNKIWKRFLMCGIVGYIGKKRLQKYY